MGRRSSSSSRGSGLRDQAQSLLEIFTRTRREGVTLRSVEDDAFVTSQLLIGVAAEQANKYSADLSGFVKAGKARQFERGERLGGPVRDGYRRVTELLGGNKVSRYDLDEERARIIRRAVELALPGAGAGAIARRSECRGLPTQDWQAVEPAARARPALQSVLRRSRRHPQGPANGARKSRATGRR